LVEEVETVKALKIARRLPFDLFDPCDSCPMSAQKTLRLKTSRSAGSNPARINL
jgi:hypothetical protein